jgi:uncharacterized cupin superfamily protein
MDDGAEMIAGPGDITSLPSRHDAWVVGDEPAVVVDWYWGQQLRQAQLTGGRRETESSRGDVRRRVQMKTKTVHGYSIADREQALDFMAHYPGYGEQRWYSDALGTEQVSFSWRRMPPGTGGRGSYGHRHPGLEEVYSVISGTVTFKVGDDVFEAGPQTAVRMTGEEFYSVHNDTDAEAELLIFSTRLTDPPLEKLDGFWPAP